MGLSDEKLRASNIGQNSALMEEESKEIPAVETKNEGEGDNWVDRWLKSGFKNRSKNRRPPSSVAVESLYESLSDKEKSKDKGDTWVNRWLNRKEIVKSWSSSKKDEISTRKSSLTSSEESDEKTSTDFPVTVSETVNHVKVAADLPNVSENSINVSISDESILSIDATRQLALNQDEKVYRNERFFGKFSRQFQLPDYIETDNYEASYVDGVLTIALPKNHLQSNIELQEHLEEVDM